MAELAEAEGRVARQAIGRLGLGLMLTLAGAILLVVAVVAVLAAIWLGMFQSIGPAWASAIAGVTGLVAAGTSLYAGWRMSK